MASFDTLGDAGKDLIGALTGAKSGNVADEIYKHAKDAGLFQDGTGLYNEGSASPWFIDGLDWYKVFAYQFVVKTGGDPSVKKDKGGFAGWVDKVKKNFSGDKDPSVPESELIYTLPIPPQSMVTRMIPASQATPTIGGVVEETSGNVFWIINMSGTTGIGVSRAADGGTKRAEVAKQFRDKITTTGLLSGPLAGVNAAISKIGGVADSLAGAGQAAASGDLGGAAAGLVGAINTALLPPLPYAGSGVDRETNGHTEMMELHRFLYTYSKLKGVQPSRYSLVFRNYKTNQEWDCIVQDFQIQQSAQSPMLYKYNIALKCWRARKAGGFLNKEEYDRFGLHGDLRAVSIIDPFQMAKLGKTMFSQIGASY